MKHWHHIVPQHAGGTDDPSNLVLLTVEEHALAHKLLYEAHGAFQDFVAWKMLSGQIGKEEAVAILAREGGKVGGKMNVKKNRSSERGMWSTEAKLLAKEKTKQLGIYSLGGKVAGAKHVKTGHLLKISSLGGKACKGNKWFHNPITGQEANVKECPEGWIIGRLNKPAFPKSALSNGKGSSWWHCPKTRISKMIKPNQIPPEGWKKGRFS